MNPGTEGGGLRPSVGDRCVFLANSHVGARLPGRQQRHLLQQRHARRPLQGRRLRHHRRRRGRAPVRAAIGAHAFVGGLSGVENDVIPYGIAHRQPGAPRRAQHRRAEAPRLLAARRSTTSAAPTGCSSPTKARCRSASRTSAASSPTHPVVHEILDFIRAGRQPLPSARRATLTRAERMPARSARRGGDHRRGRRVSRRDR